MNKTTLVVIIAVLALGAAALLYVFMSQENGANDLVRSDEAVATVNGDTITRADLDAYITQLENSGATVPDPQQEEGRREFERSALDQLINDRLLRSMISADGEVVSDADVDAGIDELRSQFASAEAFEQQLDALGITDTVLRQEIRQQISAERYFAALAETNGVAVSDADVEAAYEEVVAVQEDALPFEEVAAQIRNELEQQQLQTLVAAEVERLRAEANVEILI